MIVELVFGNRVAVLVVASSEMKAKVEVVVSVEVEFICPKKLLVWSMTLIWLCTALLD